MRSFLKTDFGIALIIAISWKLVLLSIGFIFDSIQGGATNFLDHTMRWDAGWYTTIVNDAYSTNAASAAFYPLFPLLAGSVHTITFGLLGLPLSGQLVNTVALWLALTALIRLGKLLLGKTKTYWLVLLVLSAPAAFFLHVFYGEALFLALSLWAYLFALKRNWVGVGVILALLTAARLPSLLIIGLCALEYLRSYGWSIKKAFNKHLLWFLLAPLGFIAYALYLYTLHGNALGMFSAYDATTDWAYQVFNPNIIETIAKGGYQTVRAAAGLRPFDNGLVVNNLLPFISIVILGAASLYLVFKKKGKYIPLGITGFVSIIMFSLNSNLVSVHRYALPILATYVAIGLLLNGRYKNVALTVICVVGLTVQLYLYWLFVGAVFAG